MPPKKCLHCLGMDKRAKSKADILEQCKKDDEFYLSRWRDLPHICAETNEKLPEYDLSIPNISKVIRIHCPHILPKSKYPMYRHSPENVPFLLSADAHYKLDFGGNSKVKKMNIYPIVLEIRNKLLNRIEDEQNK